jgi:hypothetical protein
MQKMCEGRCFIDGEPTLYDEKIDDFDKGAVSARYRALFLMAPGSRLLAP